MNSLLNYTEALRKKKYTGTIKIGYERGREVSITENSKQENGTCIQADFSIQNLLSPCYKIDFYGTVIVSFDNGIVVRADSVRTIQGAILERTLSG